MRHQEPAAGPPRGLLQGGTATGVLLPHDAAVTISISNTLLELFSPRGTDDFTMATGNALLCWGFGLLLV